jgi:hypothetical protein
MKVFKRETRPGEMFFDGQGALIPFRLDKVKPETAPNAGAPSGASTSPEQPGVVDVRPGPEDRQRDRRGDIRHGVSDGVPDPNAPPTA